MKRTTALFLSAGFVLLPFARADEASEARIRENLKNVSLQLRAAQEKERTMLQTQAELETKNKALDEQVKKQAANLVKLDEEMKATKASTEKIQEEQTAKITRLEGELAKHKVSLDKWQAAHVTITDIAKKKEAERAKLSAKAAELERRAADYRAKNTELYKLASEILARYEKFGIGEALAAREPFTGNAKVKLQNLVQDYGDKLLDQTAKP